MKKNINTFTKISFYFSVASLILGGALYFCAMDTTIFYRIMMIMQNSISAFGGNSVLKISEFCGVLNSGNPIHLIIGYMYALGIVIAPLCTVSFIYDVLQKLLYVGNIFSFRTGKKVLIFGYNKVIKNWIENIKDKNKYRIRIIVPEDISDDDKELLNKNHILSYIENFKNGNTDLGGFLKQQKISNDDKIIIYNDNDIDNYMILSMFLNEKNSSLLHNADIFVHCENDVIKERIDYIYKKYKDPRKTKDGDIIEDIINVEVFDINQKLINIVFDKNPIYNCFGDKRNNLDIHYLIIGLGGTGIEFILQAIHLSVFSPNNKIIFDIFDKNIDERKLELLNHFSKTALSIKKSDDMNGKYTYTVGSDMCDGELVLNFYNFDSKYKPAAMHMRELNNEKFPINIALVSLGNINDTYIAVSNLTRTLNKLNRKNNTLVYTKVESYNEGQVYFNNSDKNENYTLIPFYKEEIDIDSIIDDKILENAKEFNYQYKIISNTLEGSGDNVKDKYTLWSGIDFTYKKLSSIALSMHSKVKKWVYNNVNNGDIEKYVKIINDNFKNIPAFMDALNNNPFLDDFCKMEHRRWCYFMMTNGWSYLKNDSNIDEDDKDPILHSHNCMVNWKELKVNPNTNKTCVYDAMWIMLKAKAI